MEIRQRVRGVMLAQVHALGGNLVELGEGIQHFARPPEFAVSVPSPQLAEPAAARAAAPLEAPAIVPEVVSPAPKASQRKGKKPRRR